MLTFETIRELERQERTGKKLQRLPEDIAEQLQAYLRNKETGRELENIKNAVKRFFELREGKILEAALYTVRTGMPPENLTKEEEHVFYSLVEAVKSHREKFFSGISENVPKSKERKVAYRIKKSLPEFVGPDMKIYRLSANDIVDLPKPLNDLLLKIGIAEEVEE